jgi:hypothetical protein
VTTEPREWHAGEEELAAYASGSAHCALAASVEAHLLRCERCRCAIAAGTPTADTELAWARLADDVDRPSVSLLGRLNGGHWFTRSIVATPALLQAALVAIVLIGVVPLVASMAAGEAGVVTLLVLAPLAPMAAVAIAYRDRVDPAGEISLATPSAGLRLVTLRALLVSVVALPLAFAVLLVVDGWVADVPLSLGAAWCLPGLALAALVLLAGTTRADPAQVAAALSLGWAVGVVGTVTVRRSLRPEVFIDLIAGPAVQTTALAVALAAVALTVVRRDAVAYRRNA